MPSEERLRALQEKLAVLRRRFVAVKRSADDAVKNAAKRRDTRLAEKIREDLSALDQ